MSSNLTSHEYWDASYKVRATLQPVSVQGFRSRCARQILRKKIPLIRDSNSILELGGGASSWLAFLANSYPDKEFFSIDFSENGNRMLRDYVNRNNLDNVRVIDGDFFDGSLTSERFDFVYSHGVVEHFDNLSEVLLSHSVFLSQKGKMLSIIPNMVGILGFLTRKLNKTVYDIHVPHDLVSFLKGHHEAGLNVVESGYLCSNNFGVLSSCVEQDSSIKYKFYLSLTRLSKISWFFEEKLFGFPATKSFSPYIYVISERSK